ncbi:MAG: hypothetical protein C0489_12315 [Candidatus Accumulibacter sp.]|nr:hypothetical protein [Accumulibacter sp.]
MTLPSVLDVFATQWTSADRAVTGRPVEVRCRARYRLEAPGNDGERLAKFVDCCQGGSLGILQRSDKVVDRPHVAY